MSDILTRLTDLRARIGNPHTIDLIVCKDGKETRMEGDLVKQALVIAIATLTAGKAEASL